MSKPVLTQRQRFNRVLQKLETADDDTLNATLCLMDALIFVRKGSRASAFLSDVASRVPWMLDADAVTRAAEVLS